MESIQLIVTALVAGATAAIQGTAGQAVQDAYQALKKVISDKYRAVHADVEQLESQPESQELRKQIIEHGLKSSEAGQDAELQKLAQTLLSALKEELKQEPSKITGVSLEDIEAATLNLDDIIAAGDGHVTGVEVKGAKVKGEFNIRGVRAGNGSPSSDASPSPRSSNTSSSTPIRILFLAANPTETARLRIDEEIRGIDGALRASDLRDQFDLRPHGAVRIEDLQPLLMRHKPQIVHFSGHGDQNEIVLQNAAGKRAPVSRAALADLFRILKDNVRCVVLNACYSEHQARAINEHIDFVIGMSDAILDESASHFSHAFYQALGYGQSMQSAFDLGRNSIDLQNLGEAHKPRMLHRVDPSAVRLAQALEA